MLFSTSQMAGFRGKMKKEMGNLAKNQLFFAVLWYN